MSLWKRIKRIKRKRLVKDISSLVTDKQIAESMIADLESLTDKEWEIIDEMAHDMKKATS